MDRTELDIGDEEAPARARPRRAALDALDRLLRAHAALSGQRDQEGAYGVLRPAREEEADLVEAAFLHCGVPLPDTLRTIYRRTLGVGNPVSPIPVLAVPALRAALPDGGHGPLPVGLAAFEEKAGLPRGEAMADRPPALFLGHAAPAGLTTSRNGLWSLQDYAGRRDPPQARDFDLVFEAAFVAFVDQVLLLWANDLAGDPVRRRDLDLGRGASLPAMPPSVREAMDALLSPRAPSLRDRGEVHLLDSADLLRATRRGGDDGSAGPFGAHTAVVGLPYGERPGLADRIGLGALLRLRPVDDNPHDPDAVEVWHDDGEGSARVGFVARGDAARHRALPQGAAAWRLRVVGRSEHVLHAALEMARPDGPADQPPPDPDATLFPPGA